MLVPRCILQELAEESCDVAELSLSPLPTGGARNAMEETVVKTRVRAGSNHNGGHLFPSTHSASARHEKGKTSHGSRGGAGMGRNGGSPNGLSSIFPAAATAAARTKARRRSGAGAPESTAVEINGRTGEGDSALGSQQQQVPAKKRRNLDFGKSRAGAKGGAGLLVARPSVDLFFPQYGSGGGEDGDGRKS